MKYPMLPDVLQADAVAEATEAAVAVTEAATEAKETKKIRGVD